LKLDQETITAILNLNKLGQSSRQIAEVLGVAKSTVNNHVSKAETKALSLMNTGARILIYDLETAPALAYVFGRFDQTIGQANIYQEGGWIICASYKWLGEEDTSVIYSTSDIETAGDFGVVSRLWELFNEADVVVAHNNRKFDVKMLQARCLLNGLSPLPSVKVVDTLQMAKKHFRLPNNKLESIAAFLGVGAKVQTGGISLWTETMQGNKEALNKMLDYCLQDTQLLEKVYLKLRAFGTASNFNAANYFGDTSERCPVCGSTELTETGRSTFTDISEFAEVRCLGCGSIHRKRKILNSKEKRKSLLAGIKI
jgi:RNase_H superfamily